ncbi:MAG: hypothetical protein JSS27_01235 [Planctomycetes bacterium]|nr:hypothetical protein [Planctomycetota bacterium]
MANGRTCTQVLATLGLALLTTFANAESPAEATVALPTDGNHIFASVTFNNRSLLFALDTGSAYNVFDISLAGEIAAIQPSSDAQVTRVDGRAVVPLRLGTLDMTDMAHTKLFDFTKIRRACGKDVRGLLGMGALGRYRLEFDFDHQILHITSSQEMPDQTWGEPIYLDFDNGGRPHLNMRIAKEWQSFMIDSGANINVLSDSLFTTLVSQGLITDIHDDGIVGVKGYKSTCSGRLTKIERDGFVHHRISVTASCNTNALGLPFLSRYQIICDFPTRKCFLKKSRLHAYVEGSPDTSGLVFAAEDNRVIVEHVAVQSVAAKAGIMVKDRLIRVQDLQAIPDNIQELRNLLKRQVGKKIEVVIERSGSEMKFDVDLPLEPRRSF